MKYFQINLKKKGNIFSKQLQMLFPNLWITHMYDSEFQTNNKTTHTEEGKLSKEAETEVANRAGKKITSFSYFSNI